MDDYSRGLSLRLYDVMERVGASERMRKLHQDTCITMEIIDRPSYLIKNLNVSTYIFGSACEGTTTEGLNSDVDIVYCIDEWPVIDDIHEAPAHGLVLLMVRGDHTYPGYVKLQEVVNARPRTLFNSDINNDFELTDNNGRICRKHDKLIRTNNQNYQRHGPADTTLPCVGYKETDKVTAYRCRKIPVFANEWIGRRRYYEWPSRDQLMKMSSLGCFVVGVGHPPSLEYPIEWRLSFSLQERELMFSLNPTQHKCYILLKIIKKDIIEKFVGKSICSYHCKTCLFYTIENTRADIWRPDNLCYCLNLCLYVLWVWVYHGNCPNYFVPEENMFDRHELICLRNPLFLVLYGLLNDGYWFLFYLKCDNIGHILMNRAGFQVYRQVDEHRMKHAFENKMPLFLCLLQFRESVLRRINVINDNKETVLMLSNMLQMLMNVTTITEHTEQQTKEAVSYIIPLAHLQLAQHLAVLAFTVNDNFVIRQLFQLSDFHFRQGSNSDLMSARLMTATVLFRFKNYDMCEQILDTIDIDVTAKVFSVCRCCLKRLIRTNGITELTGNSENIPAKSIFSSSVATCVQFTQSLMEIIPPPLSLEMHRSVDTPPGSRNGRTDIWFDLAVVDGKVYTYFLQYLVFSKLNKHNHKHVAIENMKWVIQDDPNLRHTETAYNLLGWIYTQENRVKDAIQCFLESWRIRPFHNAAKWHIRKLVFDMFRQ